jgi:hypothetical protein
MSTRRTWDHGGMSSPDSGPIPSAPPRTDVTEAHPGTVTQHGIPVEGFISMGQFRDQLIALRREFRDFGDILDALSAIAAILDADLGNNAQLTLIRHVAHESGYWRA